ncbi:tail length tape measure protein [Rhodococcus phage ReqiPoco6]|uniref:Tape measure protein n=1 Tax=Rhodococcus phage ReqiPoco6 TaxID=691964 RepID=D4P7Q4_9CAUD|nr:tail length tape measure protein [Rhodococcus phage ReqiPoco6]ADD81034.1 tape measure protein [Rhodococcus phage ReqiPoco6]
MSLIEDLIVGMKFDNKQFEAGARITMATLAQLKGSMNFTGASKGIDDVQASVNRFSMDSAGAGVDTFSAKFVALSTVAITALSNITNRAIDAGINIAKALTVTPIKDGFDEYELKMGSIQTIMANTAKEYGDDKAAGLRNVTASLDELNTYADKTIYNFGDMTKNIGLFTNAGIGVKDATTMIKGFSNEAAASGTSAQGAAGAAYQLSQALSAGQITLMDWRSLTNVGMGNKNMQEGIVDIAQAMGELDKAGVTSKSVLEDFNGSLEKKWLKADVMQNYLKIQAGELNAEQMKTLGLTDEQISKFQRQSETAFEAATKVRTWTQLVGTIKEGVGSSWSETADLIIGDFDQATELFTGIMDKIEPIIGGMGDARNKLLEGWAKDGGRDAFVASIFNVIDALTSVIKPIKEAFQNIFPPATSATLISMTVAIKNFTEKLKIGGETADKLKRTFSGVFAILGIGWEIVKGVASVFGKLFGAVGSGSGGFLSLTAKIGDFLTKIHAGIKSGGLFTKIFEVLGTVLAVPIKIFGNLTEAVANFFGALGNLGGAIGQVYGILAKGDFKGGPFSEDSKIVDILFRIREAFEVVGSAVSQFWNILAKGDFVSGVFGEDSAIVDGLFKFRDMIKDFFSPGNLTKMLGIGAGGGLAVAIGMLLKKGIKFGVDDSEGGMFDTIKGMFAGIKGTFESVSGVLDSLTGSLTAMQNNIKATVLLKIAAAVGLLALSVKLLSTIDAGDLAKSMAAIATGFGMLLGAMTVMSKISGAGGLATFPAIAAGMMLMSGAILILAAAAKVFASMEWDEILRGLVGVGVTMGLLVGAAYGLGKAEGPMLRAGLAMIPLAIGIRILATAIKAMGDIQWPELIRGLTGLTVSLAAITLALRYMPENMPAIGLGLTLVGAGLLVIATAVKQMGNTDTDVLVKGLIGISAALAAITLALRFMPKNMPSIGFGLIMVAGALQLITGAIKTMGGMEWEELIRGLVGLGGAMAIMTIALSLMSGTLAGSAALMVASLALAMLIPPLMLLSAMSWQDLLTGLGGLAGIFTVIGLAGLLLTPVLPAILGLGAAMAMIGVGMVAVGAGALLFSMALTAVVNVLALGKTALVNLADTFPLLATRFGEAMTAFIVSLGANAGKIVGAFKDLLVKMLDAVIEIAPKIGQTVSTLLQTFLQLIIDNAPMIGAAFSTLIQTLLNIVTENAPKIWDAGFNLITGFLGTIRDRVPEIVTIATDIIVNFINAISNNLPRIVQAGFDLVINFLNSLANSIRANSGLVTDAALNVADAIIDGMVQGISRGIGRVVDAAKNMASNALNAAKNFLGINSPSKEFRYIGEWVGEGFVQGMERSEPHVKMGAISLAKTALNATQHELRGISSMFQEAMSILFDGDFKGIGPWQEDDPIVNTLFNIREGLAGIGGAAQEVWSILGSGDFQGVGPWEEDDPIVDTLFNIRAGLSGIGAVATSVFSILGKGKFVSTGGILEEDSPIVDTLFNIREGFEAIQGSAKEAWSILTENDFKGIGPWDEDSPIVDTLFNIRKGFEDFQDVGQDAIQGLINGLQDGANNVAKAAHDIATGALDSAKTALGIRSPSREFKKVGDDSVQGLVNGVNDGLDKVEKSGENMATKLFGGFTKSIGTGMPDVVESIVKVLKSGEGDLNIGGPNAPLTWQLKGLNQALKQTDLQLAIFFGAVDAADPKALEEYVEKAANNLTFLAGILDGLASSANQAFAKLKEGETLDKVIGNEDFLSGILNAVLSLVPGVEGAAIRLGVTLVNGLFGAIFGETLLGMLGNFVQKAIQTVAGWFGIKFPVKEEIKEGEKALDDFIVKVEGGVGRFNKLTEEGVKALTNTLVGVNAAVDEINTQPKITPVLELKQFNRDSASMLDGLNSASISLDTSAGKADTLFNKQREFAENQSIVEPVQPNINIEYNQTNNSPKPISHVEVFRQTKSQLSLTKEALKVS